MPIPRFISSAFHGCADIEGFDALAELALDLRSSWNHATDRIWRTLNPEHWELTHNPWVVLQTVSRQTLERLLASPDFRQEVEDLLQARRHASVLPSWFQNTYSHEALGTVAYFCMEFMLSEALPIYSGGLGNVAGDQLKAASDMGVPLIGIGLLYQQGYFRQFIDQYGRQQALFPYNDPGQLPIVPLRFADGEWVRIKVELPAYSVWLRAWEAQVGRVKLYLLDSNDAANVPVHRGITSDLYGGGHELRLQQEILLGIGGWRLLMALDIEPEICHLNEGHAAFAVLERAAQFMHTYALPFDAALDITRAGNLFTTHTAVAAGFDRFEPSLIRQYLTTYAEQTLGIPVESLLAMGRQTPEDPHEPFTTAYLAIRGSGAVNGVSRLHARVSRHLFAPLFPRWPIHEVPIGHVTNGIHMPSWDSVSADELWTNVCGHDRWHGAAEGIGEPIRQVPLARLWQLRLAASTTLVEYIRERLSRQLAASGSPHHAIEGAKRIFDPGTLTLGFARRFAEYKRPNLLLHDPERLFRLLNDSERPVQLVIAGKAHPADLTGQAMIQAWLRFIQHPDAVDRVVFLSDYDMQVAEQLVQGIDVWINTPRRPWEASGTSGMKVLVNGGLNLSVLDGWWAEAFSPEVGWAIGDGLEHENYAAWDAAEARDLYARLEREIIPEFYDRDESGIPCAWVSRMRESMATLTTQYSTNRSLREYVEKYYLSAATSLRHRVAECQCGAYQHGIRQDRPVLDVRRWAGVHFGASSAYTRDRQIRFEVEVYLGDIAVDAAQVELYAEGVASSEPEIIPMQCLRQLANAANGYVYQGVVETTRPKTDYTARVIPHHYGRAIPLENQNIVWQR
ncbi:alpha-glucan family phosphorylase [Vreelandella rituensis]|uniref:Alpha-glucan family phosphorylase n=1 Tax=Vreelandella rituensis TaxID=2282306 RepID=A0A368TRP0_9GAMM|nr:alpha-glucan family phosphorylase [Halomonas rituensis]RCV85903.1 alpha-glucan family phosphorylase [Halomonas rituensis]